jgi:hypothetical protein
MVGNPFANPTDLSSPRLVGNAIANPTDLSSPRLVGNSFANPTDSHYNQPSPPAENPMTHTEKGLGLQHVTELTPSPTVEEHVLSQPAEPVDAGSSTADDQMSIDAEG